VINHHPSPGLSLSTPATHTIALRLCHLTSLTNRHFSSRNSSTSVASPILEKLFELAGGPTPAFGGTTAEMSSVLSVLRRGMVG
jgi:hypothetical protein